MICVGVDVDGVVYVTGETYPACTDFMLATPAQFDKNTYWANVSLELEDSGNMAALMSATLLVFITAWGIRRLVQIIAHR